MPHTPRHPEIFDDEKLREMALRIGILQFEGGARKPPAPGERAKPEIPWYLRPFLWRT